MVTRAAAKRKAAFLAEARSKPTDGSQLLSLDQNLSGLTPPAVAKKRRCGSNKASEPTTGGWDILPHGLGKKGDLRSESNDGKAPPMEFRKQDQAKLRVKQEVSGEPVEYQPERAAVKEEDVKKIHEEETTRKKTDMDTSADVVEKVKELIDASGKVPRKSRKVKTNKYGLTPGQSPFPDLLKPTPEDCEEVARLLSELHGEVKAPDVIPRPSMEVTGCGEVPDLLDAILRTLLSASTTANNSNNALKGLKNAFGLRTSGLGIGSVNWEAVHAAELKNVVDSIRSGGLAEVKGANIKKILAAVWQHNKDRRNALAKEKETGQTAEITGVQHVSQTAKDKEIEAVDNGMLSMDYVFELTTDEAMMEMLKLPGIGVKTASCVILFCMKRPSFAVDTHVWRHCKWLGWVPPTATRDQTFSHCEVRIPDHLKYPLHQLFLRHGKTCGRCRAATSVGSDDWEKANCPIDHLMTRTEAKKLAGTKKPVPKLKMKKGSSKQKSKKMKKEGEDTYSKEGEILEPHDDNDDDDDE